MDFYKYQKYKKKYLDIKKTLEGGEMLSTNSIPCPITGESICHCTKKEILRKLFTDHAIYTKFFIESSLNNLPDLDVITARLLDNQMEIGKYVGTIVGESNGIKLSNLLKEHILLAAECIEKLKKNESKELNIAIEKLMENATKVGIFLNTLNPEKLPLAMITEEFKQHNKYVLNIATLHSKGKYKEEIETYDIYYKHMLMLSDTIFRAL